MSNQAIRLNRAQITFLHEMLDTTDTAAAVKKFAELMVLERVSPEEMAKVIDIIMERLKNK